MICEYTEILNELKRKIAELVSREPSAGRLYYLMGIEADLEEMTGKLRADVLEKVSRDIVLDADEGIDYTAQSESLRTFLPVVLKGQNAEEQEVCRNLEEKIDALVPVEEHPYPVPENWRWVRLGAAYTISPKVIADDNAIAAFVPMEKISPGSSGVLPGDQHILIDLASWHKTALSEKIGLLHAAIEQHRLVSFHYLSPNGESNRTVEPSLLVFQWSSWYLWSWCREKAAPRLFKLDRMDSLQIGEAFSPRQMEPPDLLGERAFPDRYHVVVRISPKYKWRLVEEYGPDSFELTPEGDCLFSAGFTDRDHLLGWILSFQGEAELLEPPELRDELRNIGKKIQQKHHT